MNGEFVFGGYFLGIEVNGKEYDDGHIIVLKNAGKGFLEKLEKRGYKVNGAKGKYVVLVNYKDDFQPMKKEAFLKEKEYGYEEMMEDFYGDE